MRQKEIVLLNCSIIYAIFHAGRQLLPPMMPSIVQDFNLTYTQAGILLSSYEIGYALTLLAAGVLSDRRRKTPFIALSVLLFGIATVVTPFLGDLNQVLAARIVAGMGYGLYFGAGVSLISLYFSSRERGKAMGVHGIGNGAGKFYSPLMVALFITTLGWRPIFHFVALPALMMALVAWRTVEEPPSTDKTSIKLTAELRGLVTNSRLLRISLSSGIAIGTAQVLISYLPLYIVNTLHQDKVVGAGSLVFFSVLATAGNFAFPALSDRFGRRLVASVIFAASSPLLLVFSSLRFDASLLLVIALLGLLTSAPFTVLTAYVTEIGGKYNRGAFLGFFNTITTLSAAVSQMLAGAASDALGVSSIFYFLAVACVAGVFTVPKSRHELLEPHAWNGAAAASTDKYSPRRGTLDDSRCNSCRAS